MKTEVAGKAQGKLAKCAPCTRQYPKSNSLESQATLGCWYNHYSHFQEVNLRHREVRNFPQVTQLISSQKLRFELGWFLQLYYSYTTFLEKQLSENVWHTHNF